MKKYRLKINYSEITKENFDLVQRIREEGVDGKICYNVKDTLFRFEGIGTWDFFDIPKSWLTEIKEALTAQEWMKSKEDETVLLEGPGCLWDDQDIIDAWNAAIENYKLSQEINEVVGDHDVEKFNELVDIYEKSHSKLSDPVAVYWFWQAALKYARNQS